MDITEDIEQSLEPVEYLTRSPTRIRILDALDKDARTRDELLEVTDVSRFTVSRTLAEFEDRGWIRRSGDVYELTGEGSFVTSELTSLLSNLAVTSKLDGTLDWLQTDEFDFDIVHLQDATVYTPSKTNHTAHIRAPAEAVRNADRVRSTVTGVAHEMIEAVWESTVNGNLQLAGVIDDQTFSAIRTDDDLFELVREMLQSGDVDLYRYDGEDPLVMLLICDDTVMLCGHDEDDPAPGTIESEDTVVRSWATSYFEATRSKALPLDAGSFST